MRSVRISVSANITVSNTVPRHVSGPIRKVANLGNFRPLQKQRNQAVKPAVTDHGLRDLHVFGNSVIPTERGDDFGNRFGFSSRVNALEADNDSSKRNIRLLLRGKRCSSFEYASSHQRSSRIT